VKIGGTITVNNIGGTITVNNISATCISCQLIFGDEQ
jgi:hypothetical protein